MDSSSSKSSCPRQSGYHPLPGGGAMKPGEITGLPLVPCPKCGSEILELVSGPASKVPGSVFFKCRWHDRDDPKTCPWYLFADKYERMLIGKGVIGATRVETEQPVTDLNYEVPILDGRDNVQAILGSLDAKMKKLVILGQIGVVGTLVVAVLFLVYVIFLLMNRK